MMFMSVLYPTYDVPVCAGEGELVVPLHVPLSAQWAPHQCLITPAVYDIIASHYKRVHK